MYEPRGGGRCPAVEARGFHDLRGDTREVRVFEWIKGHPLVPYNIRPTRQVTEVHLSCCTEATSRESRIEQLVPTLLGRCPDDPPALYGMHRWCNPRRVDSHPRVVDVAGCAVGAAPATDDIASSDRGRLTARDECVQPPTWLRCLLGRCNPPRAKCCRDGEHYHSCQTKWSTRLTSTSSSLFGQAVDRHRESPYGIGVADATGVTVGVAAQLPAKQHT